MSIKYESGFSTILGLSLNSTDTVITLAVAPTVTNGRMYIFDGTQKEWVDFTGVSGVTITGCTRNVSKTADPMTGGTGYNFNAGTPVVLVAMHDQLPDKTTANTFVGDQTITGNLSVSGDVTVDEASFIKGSFATSYASTALRDAALGANGVATHPYQGILAGGLFYNYNTTTAQRESIDTGTATPPATTTTLGSVELATQAEVNAGTNTGSVGPLAVQPAELKVVTDALAASLAAQVAINNRRFGTGADGAQTGALTITGSNDTYILKQYTSFTPGANTVTITPTNCILHIKVTGNVDLTGTTFNFAGKGGAGGGGVFNAPGNNGSDAIASMGRIRGGYGTGTALVDYGLAGYFGNDLNPFIKASCGSGGGAGGGDGFAAGGNGGAGGGCVIIECGGNLTFSSTTENFNGLNGSNGSGGGGGGGGGSIIHLYRGTLIGTPTVNVAGGTGGTPAGTAGGGNGGSSLIGLGDTQVSSTGGNGATGVSVLQQI